MPVDTQQLATQIYIQMIAPCLMERASQGSNLDKLFKGAAANSIAAAEEFARAYDEQMTLPTAPG